MTWEDFRRLNDVRCADQAISAGRVESNAAALMDFCGLTVEALTVAQAAVLLEAALRMAYSYTEESCY